MYIRNEIGKKIAQIIEDNQIDVFKDFFSTFQDKENLLRDIYNYVLSYKNLYFLEFLLKDYFNDNFICVSILNFFQQKNYSMGAEEYLNFIFKCFKLFIDYGFKLDKSIERNVTPLILGVIYNNLNYIKFLIENGADVNFANEDGITPLMLAIKKNVDTEIIDYLISLSDISKVDKQGNTYLHIACNIINSKNYKIRKNIIEKLVTDGLDINSQNNNGETPLHILCEKVNKVDSEYQSELIKFLLKLGASKNIVTIEDVLTKNYLFLKGSTPIDIIKTKNARKIQFVLTNN